jgi:hypothetical protein
LFSPPFVGIKAASSHKISSKPTNYYPTSFSYLLMYLEDFLNENAAGSSSDIPVLAQKCHGWIIFICNTEHSVQPDLPMS